MYIEQNNINFLNDIITIIEKFPTNVIPSLESNMHGFANTLYIGKDMYDFNGNIITGTMSNAYYYNIIDDTISDFIDITNSIDRIRDYAFASCTSLTSVSFPACTSIGCGTFQYCSSLTSVSFPACTNIGSSAFYGCTSLTSVNFPVCTSIVGYAFSSCTSLTSVSFPACTYIDYGIFYNCRSLTSLTLGASTVCTLKGTNTFTNTPMSNSTYTGTFGSIYVPASLVDAYKSATNWATYSDRIVGIG